eukprot:366337-Chlamydomonas_euryale.AAC.12
MVPRRKIPRLPAAHVIITKVIAHKAIKLAIQCHTHACIRCQLSATAQLLKDPWLNQCAAADQCSVHATG